MSKTIHAVTGAFGYSGKYIAKLLLDKGKHVITITNSLLRPNPFGDKLKAFAFNFDKPELLAESLKDVKVLYNTYRVRFNHKTFTHADAVRNTKILFEAAKKAGVEKIVHVSITNPRIDSDLEYFSGKAELENALKATGISYSILRPTVIFGQEDILLNNIAWVMRRFPIVGVFGDGEYKLQPLHVEDLAELAVHEGANPNSVTIDAIGKETYTYKGLIQTIGKIIGKERKIISVSDNLGYFVAKIVGWLKKDTFLTREEIKGLKENYLFTQSPGIGKIILSRWAAKHKDTLGKRYSGELTRRKNRSKTYEELRFD